MNPKLSWLERAIETNKFHIEKLRIDAKWTIDKTAKALHRSHGSIDEDLLLASWLKTNPKLEALKTAKEALAAIRKYRKALRIRE